MEQHSASKHIGNVPTALISCRIFIGPMSLISCRSLFYLQEFVRAVPFKSIGVGRNAGQLFLLCRGVLSQY